jgi:hypothetical protein
MAFIEQLMQRLEAASGDTRAQAAVAAEFVLMTRPEPEREPLRSALDAAAVLRWFDARLMEKVLGIPDDDAWKRFEELKALPFVERYRMGEHDLRNVHESTRLGWRKQLAHEQPEHFAHLSAKVAACFADDLTPAGRIEWIYHLLCGDPKRGATELESLNSNWDNCARPGDRYALASALNELEDTRLVQGGARVWVLLTSTWVRVSRGESAQLADGAGKILELARAAKDSRAEADAQCMQRKRRLNSISRSAGVWPIRTRATRVGSGTWLWPIAGLATFCGRRENWRRLKQRLEKLSRSSSV